MKIRQRAERCCSTELPDSNPNISGVKYVDAGVHLSGCPIGSTSPPASPPAKFLLPAQGPSHVRTCLVCLPHWRHAYSSTRPAWPSCSSLICAASGADKPPCTCPWLPPGCTPTGAVFAQPQCVQAGLLTCQQHWAAFGSMLGTGTRMGSGVGQGTSMTQLHGRSSHILTWQCKASKRPWRWLSGRQHEPRYPPQQAEGSVMRMLQLCYPQVRNLKLRDLAQDQAALLLRSSFT